MDTRTLFLASALLAASTAASAQQAPLRPVTWSLSLAAAPRAGTLGASGMAELRARIEPGWHLYSLTQPAGGARATAVAIVSDPPFRVVGAIGRPAPDTIPDANFGIMSEVYDDSVTFHLPLGIRSRAPRGTTELVVAITYQACSSRLCLSPRTDSVAVSVPAHR